MSVADELEHVHIGELVHMSIPGELEHERIGELVHMNTADGLEREHIGELSHMHCCREMNHKRCSELEQQHISQQLDMSDDSPKAQQQLIYGLEFVEQYFSRLELRYNSQQLDASGDRPKAEQYVDVSRLERAQQRSLQLELRCTSFRLHVGRSVQHVVLNGIEFGSGKSVLCRLNFIHININMKLLAQLIFMLGSLIYLLGWIFRSNQRDSLLVSLQQTNEARQLF